MDFADPQTYYLLAALLGAGVLAGFSSGLFGIGGGVVLVPALVTILPYFRTAPQVVMHVAVGTCLALIVPGAVMAARKQYQMKKLELKVLGFWVQMVLVGVVAGVILINYLTAESLKIFFACYLSAAAMYSFFKKPPATGHESIPGRGLQRAVGLPVGCLSVLLGIGGGTFTVPFFKFFHYPLKKAIALSTATSLFIGLGGAIGTIIDGMGVAGRPDYSFGYVNLVALVLITPLMMIFAPLGSQAANAISDPKLRSIYTGFLATMAGYMFWKLSS